MSSYLSFLLGSAPSPSSSSSQPDLIHSTKHQFRYVDPISSLVGLAIIAGMRGENPKIALGKGRLYPKTIRAATKDWSPSAFNVEAMPKVLQKTAQSLDRALSGDSRDFLVFYNHAIPFTAKVYPTSSVDSEQNDVMKILWKLVKEGIEILENSYESELKKPLTTDNKFIMRNKMTLKMKQTIGKTFSKWNKTIRTYLDAKPEHLHTNNEQSQPREFDEEKQLLEATKGPSGSMEFDLGEGVLETFNVQPQSKMKKKDESKPEKELNPLLKHLSEFLKYWFCLIPKSETEKEIHENFYRFANLTIQDGNTPNKLNCLSHKIKNIWKIEDLKQVIKEIHDFKTSDEPNRSALLNSLEINLDTRANLFMKLVDKELDKAVLT